MRKIKSARKLGRTASHRAATLANLSTALIVHKRIETTEAKAKETRKVVEKVITRAKEGTLHAQREVFRFIKDKAAIKELFGDIATKVGARNGGYTRVIKLAPRYGDGAKMAIIELVDFAIEAEAAPKQQKQDRSKRVRGSKEKSAKTETPDGATPKGGKEKKPDA
ncbi:MAG: 50S ribosomal protein L17 [Rhizobacter sp.]|nr:50S ribosomal protein L17 [Chlorobiales bacterium]